MKTKNDFYAGCCFLNGDYCRWKKQDCPVLYSKANDCESFRKGSPLKTVVIEEMIKKGVIPDGVGEIVPVPEEVKSEREFCKRVLNSLRTRSFSIVANIFSLAIILQRDLYEDLSYCETVMEYYENSIYTPKLESSIQFLALLADEMNCPITLFFSMTEENRKKMVYDLVDQYQQLIKSRRAWYDFDSDFEERLSQKTIIQITLEEFATGRVFHKNRDIKNSLSDDEDPYYEIVLGRSWDEDKQSCVYSFSYEQHLMISQKIVFNYMFTGCEIYEEYEGKLKDLIESIIEIEASKQTKISFDEVKSDNSESSETDKEEKEKVVENIKNKETEIRKNEKPEEKDHRGKIKKETLVKHIYSDTRTIDLLDEFEGIGDKNIYVYDKIEIPYAMRIRNLKKSFSISLVVKRCKASECVGDITFTEYKQDKVSDLKEYISKQITDEVLKKYQGKREIFYFSKPYHLRAQNSLNRTGYGWEWDWSGGVGDYIEGTLYGETTDYGFVGAYINL